MDDYSKNYTHEIKNSIKPVTKVINAYNNYIENDQFINEIVYRTINRLVSLSKYEMKSIDGEIYLAILYKINSLNINNLYTINVRKIFNNVTKLHMKNPDNVNPIYELFLYILFTDHEGLFPDIDKVILQYMVEAQDEEELYMMIITYGIYDKLNNHKIDNEANKFGPRFIMNNIIGSLNKYYRLAKQDILSTYKIKGFNEIYEDIGDVVELRYKNECVTLQRPSALYLHGIPMNQLMSAGGDNATNSINLDNFNMSELHRIYKFIIEKRETYKNPMSHTNSILDLEKDFKNNMRLYHDLFDRRNEIGMDYVKVILALMRMTCDISLYASHQSYLANVNSDKNVDMKCMTAPSTTIE